MFFAKQLRSFLLKFRFSGKCIISLAALPLILTLFATIAHSAEVGLQWDPTTEPELAGYKLYYGLDSGNYTSSMDVGNQTSFTLSNLEYDTVYYFAVTAYSIDGGESDYSGEIFYSVPLPDASGSGGSPDVLPVDSDNDGISDTDEINIYGTNPYNPDSDGDGVADGAEISAGSDPTDPNSVPAYTKIWLEAEDGDLYAPMEIAGDENASAGGYIWVPNGGGSGGYAEYTFEVQEPGDYVIWGRVISNDDSSDSFLVSIDGGDDITWHTKNGGQETWTWDVVSNRDYADVRDASNPTLHHLEAGSHVLTIKHLEDVTKIDKIFITNDMEYVPEGADNGQLFPSGIIEAESGVLTSPLQSISDMAASGGSYVETTEPESGTAIYTFNIDDPGVYKIIARVYAADGGSDSFYVNIDDKGEFIWDLTQDPNEFNVWREDEITNRGTGTSDNPQYDPYTVEFDQGVHTIALRGRESSSKLDYFYFQKVGDILPSTVDTIVPEVQTAPVVSITSPGDGAFLFSNLATVQVEASDDVNVERIELYVDGILQKLEYSSQLDWKWMTNKEPAGQHTISAKAYDTDGNMGVDSVVVYK